MNYENQTKTMVVEITMTGSMVCNSLVPPWRSPWQAQWCATAWYLLGLLGERIMYLATSRILLATVKCQWIWDGKCLIAFSIFSLGLIILHGFFVRWKSGSEMSGWLAALISVLDLTPGRAFELRLLLSCSRLQLKHIQKLIQSSN